MTEKQKKEMERIIALLASSCNPDLYLILEAEVRKFYHREIEVVIVGDVLFSEDPKMQNECAEAFRELMKEKE